MIFNTVEYLLSCYSVLIPQLIHIDKRNTKPTPWGKYRPPNDIANINDSAAAKSADDPYAIYIRFMNYNKHRKQNTAGLPDPLVGLT